MDKFASHLVRATAVVLLSTTLGERSMADPRPVVELELPLLGKGERTFRPSCSWLSYSPDGKWLATRYRISDEKDCVRVWSCADWKSVDLEVDCDWLKSSHVSEYCAFDGKSTTLYLASDGLLYAHKLPLKSPPRTLPLVGERKPKGVAYSLSLLQEGKVLQVISNCDYGSRLQLERFDAADPAAGTKVFSERLKPDCTPAVSPDGSLMAIGTSTERKDFGRDYSLEIWSVVPSKRLAHYDKLGGDLTVMRFTPDGKVLATGGSDGTLALYDVGTGKLTRTLTENYTVSSVDFHPSRPYLAYTTYDRHGTPNLGIVDLPSGLEIGKSSVDVYGARQVCFSPDGKTVVTVGGEAQVRVWEFGSLIEK